MGLLNNILSKLRKDKNPLTKEEKELLEKLKSCTMTDGVHTYYTRFIKGRQNESYENTKKLLIRNIILAEEADKDKENPHRRLFYYGNLSIIYDEENNEIVWVKNYKSCKGVKINKDKKLWLNEELGTMDRKMDSTYNIENKYYIIGIDLAKEC